jgi:hypothetical protein
MTDTHLTAPTHFVEADGDTFAYRNVLAQTQYRGVFGLRPGTGHGSAGDCPAIHPA